MRPHTPTPVSKGSGRDRSRRRERLYDYSSSVPRHTQERWSDAGGGCVLAQRSRHFPSSNRKEYDSRPANLLPCERRCAPSVSTKNTGVTVTTCRLSTPRPWGPGGLGFGLGSCTGPSLSLRDPRTPCTGVPCGPGPKGSGHLCLPSLSFPDVGPVVPPVYEQVASTRRLREPDGDGTGPGVDRETPRRTILLPDRDFGRTRDNAGQGGVKRRPAHYLETAPV